MAKKKASNKVPLPIRIIVYAALLFAIYNSISTLALGLWGDTVTGTIDSYSSRVDDLHTEHSYTVSKRYWFMVDGKEYRGFVMYGSNKFTGNMSKGQTRSERIRYLGFFPYINKPAMLCDFNEMGDGTIIYHILAPIACLLLLRLVIRSSKDGKKKKTSVRKPVATSAAHVEPQIIQARSRSAKDMFCPNCGSKLPEDAAFCSECGAKIQTSTPGLCKVCGAKLQEGAEFCIECGTAVNLEASRPMEPSQASPSAPPQGKAGLVGFSDRCNSPEILAVAQENKKFSIGCMWILVVVPLIGFPVAGMLMDDFPFGESIVVGVGIAIVMLVLNLIAMRRTKQPMWEGVVANKYKKEKYKHRDGNETYTEFTTVITTDAGKKKTIVEVDSRRHMYDYLSVGDRVRYHPKFGTYEKYDKSKDRIIYCNVCIKMNPIQNDRCKWCNNLLFK